MINADRAALKVDTVPCQTNGFWFSDAAEQDKLQDAAVTVPLDYDEELHYLLVGQGLNVFSHLSRKGSKLRGVGADHPIPNGLIERLAENAMHIADGFWWQGWLVVFSALKPVI